MYTVVKGTVTFICLLFLSRRGLAKEVENFVYNHRGISPKQSEAIGDTNDVNIGDRSKYERNTDNHSKGTTGVNLEHLESSKTQRALQFVEYSENISDQNAMGYETKNNTLKSHKKNVIIPASSRKKSEVHLSYTQTMLAKNRIINKSAISKSESSLENVIRKYHIPVGNNQKQYSKTTRNYKNNLGDNNITSKRVPFNADLNLKFRIQDTIILEEETPYFVSNKERSSDHLQDSYNIHDGNNVSETGAMDSIVMGYEDHAQRAKVPGRSDSRCRRSIRDSDYDDDVEESTTQRNEINYNSLEEEDKEADNEDYNNSEDIPEDYPASKEGNQLRNYDEFKTLRNVAELALISYKNENSTLRIMNYMNRNSSKIPNYNEQLLLILAAENDTLTTKTILQNAENIYFSDKNRNTALHHAVMNGNSPLALAICEKNASGINELNAFNETALLIASSRNDTKIFQLLLDKGADPYIPNGLTCLHVATKKKHHEIVEMILAKTKTGIDERDNDGYTALSLAVLDSNRLLVNILLTAGADPVIADFEGQTALHLAIKVRSEAILDIILNVNRNSINIIDRKGMTPLLLATFHGLLSVFKILVINGADPNIADSNGVSPLHAACAVGNVEIVQTMFNLSKPHPNLRDEDGNTPLHYAVNMQQIQLVSVLLMMGADPKIANKNSRTPLHTGAAMGDQEIVVAILNASKSVLEIRDRLGYTALHLAVSSGHISVVQTLIQFGADPNAVDSIGFNALRVAVEENGTDNLETSNGVNLIKYLLSIGSDPYNLDQSGCTALHAAAKKGNAVVVSNILNNFPNGINIQKTNGTTALSWAIFYRNNDVAALLLENGADPYIQGNYGRTSLHVAVSRGEVEVIRRLLSTNKAGVNMKDVIGNTALFYAVLFSDILFPEDDDSNIPGAKSISDVPVGAVTEDEYYVNSKKTMVSVSELRTCAGSKIPESVISGFIHGINELIENSKISYSVNEIFLNPGRIIFSAYGVPGQGYPSSPGGFAGCYQPGYHYRSEDEISRLRYRRIEMLDLLMHNDADYKTLDVKRNTVLHKAVEGTDKEVLEYFMEGVKFKEINTKNINGETPLHIAVKRGNLNASKYLLGNGVDPYLTDNNKRTPLHVAAEMHNIDIMKLIVDYSKDGIDLKDDTGLTALSLSTVRGDKAEELCKVLIESGADPYIADDEGNTAVHAAVIEAVQRTLYRQRVFNELPTAGIPAIYTSPICLGIFDFFGRNVKYNSLVELLIKFNSSGVNLRNNRGYTALFLSALHSRNDLMDVLLDCGADTYVTDFQGQSSLHALILASTDFERSLELLQKILATNNSGVNIQDSYGYTALHYAAFRNLSTIVHELTKNGADPNIAENQYGWTPLHIAVKHGDMTSVKVMLENPETDVNAQNEDGVAPLHLASVEEMANFLISKGADVEQRDRRGWNFLHYLAFEGERDMLAQVVSVKNVKNIDDPSLFGETPLNIATARHDDSLVKYLLKKGAGPEYPQEYTVPPLEIAVKGNYTDSMFEVLSKNREHLMMYNMYGLNILHTASWEGRLHIVRMIVEKYNTPVDYPDRYGHTALHYAAIGVKGEVLEYLLARGASPLVTDDFGQNVLHYAAESCNRSIIKLICQSAKKIANNSEFIKFINKRNFLDITALQFSAFNGNSEAFHVLWNEGAIWNDTSHASYHSILFPAALGGNTKIINYILKKSNISVNEATVTGLTPLMTAAAKGRKGAFEIFIKKGARIDSAAVYGQSMLHFSALGGDTEIMQAVLNNTDVTVNTRDVEGFTPLMNAVSYDKLAAVELLLDSGADPLMKNIYGEDAIQIAAKVGNEVLKSKLFDVRQDVDKVLGILLARQNASYDRQILFDLVDKSSLRKHPVFLAAAKGDMTALETIFSSPIRIRYRSFPNLIKELMREFNAVINDITDSEDNSLSKEDRLSPLEIALLFHQNLTVVKNIIQNLKVKSINYKATTWTPLDYAIFSQSKFLNNSTTNVLLYFLNKCKNTLNDSTNVFGWTSAHKAAWIGSAQAISFLYYYGADLDKADKFGRTPLHYAALNGHSKVVNTILHVTKTSINIRDNHGFTPLLLSRVYNHRQFFRRLSNISSDSPSKERFSLIQMSDIVSKISRIGEEEYFLTAISLIAHKADLDVQDTAFGWTALHWATVNGDYQCVQLLVSGGAKVNLPSWTGETPLLIARKWMRTQTYNYLKSLNGVW